MSSGLVAYLPPCSVLTKAQEESTDMVPEPEDQLASLISALFVIRLVTVRVSSVRRHRSDHHVPVGQNFEGQFCHRSSNRAVLTLVIVVASAMFIWDYILTFRMEFDLIWKSRWNFMKGIYLFQRYLPFIDTVWLVLYRQSHIFSTFLCSFLLRSNGGEFDGKYLSECILCQWRFVKLTRPHINTK